MTRAVPPSRDSIERFALDAEHAATLAASSGFRVSAQKLTTIAETLRWALGEPEGQSVAEWVQLCRGRLRVIDPPE